MKIIMGRVIYHVEPRTWNRTMSVSEVLQLVQDGIGIIDTKEVLNNLVERASHLFPAHDQRSPHINECCTLLRAIGAIFVGLSDSDKKTEAPKIVQLICIPNIENFTHIRNEIANSASEETAYLSPSVAAADLPISGYLNLVAKLLIDILPFTSPEIALNVFEHIFDHFTTSFTDKESAADLKQASLLLLYTLLVNGHSLDSQVLTYVFGKVQLLLVAADHVVVHLVCSLVLPLLLTDVSRVDAMWSFIESIWARKRTTEVQQLDIVLTLLCTLVHVFVPLLSSIIPRAPTAKLSDNLSRDMRGNKVFWEVVQCGISDSDPLSRKRSLFLISRVILSLEGPNGHEGAHNKVTMEDDTAGAMSSEGFIFWWDKSHKDMLHSIWEDVVLMLETLEEKQVSCLSISFILMSIHM